MGDSYVMIGRAHRADSTASSTAQAHQHQHHPHQQSHTHTHHQQQQQQHQDTTTISNDSARPRSASGSQHPHTSDVLMSSYSSPQWLSDEPYSASTTATSTTSGNNATAPTSSIDPSDGIVNMASASRKRKSDAQEHIYCPHHHQSTRQRSATCLPPATGTKSKSSISNSASSTVTACSSSPRCSIRPRHNTFTSPFRDDTHYCSDSAVSPARASARVVSTATATTSSTAASSSTSSRESGRADNGAYPVDSDEHYHEEERHDHGERCCSCDAASLDVTNVNARHKQLQLEDQSAQFEEQATDTALLAVGHHLKRPRLAAAASTGHMNDSNKAEAHHSQSTRSLSPSLTHHVQQVPHSRLLSLRQNKAHPSSSPASTSSLHRIDHPTVTPIVCNTAEEQQYEEEVANRSPSAPCSSVTGIVNTRPPSPAYAAFSLHTPAPPNHQRNHRDYLLPSSPTSPGISAYSTSNSISVSDSAAESQVQQYQGEPNSDAGDELSYRPQQPQHSQSNDISSDHRDFEEQDQRDQAGIASSPTLRTPATRRSVAQHFRRSTSLPLVDELTLSQSDGTGRNQEQQQDPRQNRMHERGDFSTSAMLNIKTCFSSALQQSIPSLSNSSSVEHKDEVMEDVGDTGTTTATTVLSGQDTDAVAISVCQTHQDDVDHIAHLPTVSNSSNIHTRNIAGEGTPSVTKHRLSNCETITPASPMSSASRAACTSTGLGRRSTLTGLSTPSDKSVPSNELVTADPQSSTRSIAHHTEATRQTSHLPMLTATQLAALHQFNMPRNRPAVRQGFSVRPQSRFPPLPVRAPASITHAPAIVAEQSIRKTEAPAIAGRVASFSGFPVATGAGAPTFNQVRPGAGTRSTDTRQEPPVANIPAIVPPIARETLKELDLQEILQCRQLRHDVVFDAKLMFRPNFDGDRGDRKREAADRYWQALTRELQSGCRCTAYPFAPSATARMMGRLSIPLPCICRKSKPADDRNSLSARLPSRVSALITELRDILLALLPLASGGDLQRQNGSGKSAKAFAANPTTTLAAVQMINETLDSELIAQEVAHGVLDVISLANFFGQILKSHCAPMRDELVETMVESIRKGGEKNDMSLVSYGLRLCFEVLELMKLDIANHQLRMLRPYLLETAAEFECNTLPQLIESQKTEHIGQSEESEDPSMQGAVKTKSWLTSASNRLAAASFGTVELGTHRTQTAIEGVMELLFNPDLQEHPAALSRLPYGKHAAGSPEAIAALQRSRRYKLLSLPMSAEVPETLHLDLTRLQLFHGDVVDLCIVQLLLLLFRQLCLARQPSPTLQEVEDMRRQIWVIMTEVNTGATVVSSASLVGSKRQNLPLPQSIKKLDSERWREGMKDVLLQIARQSSGEAAYVPDAAMLTLLDGWMETNLKQSSKLYQLVQNRLRKGLSSLVEYEIERAVKLNGKSWELVSAESPALPSVEETTIIKSNGLIDLSGEVHLLASRIAKVVGFNVLVYSELYSSILA